MPGLLERAPGRARAASLPSAPCWPAPGRGVPPEPLRSPARGTRLTRAGPDTHTLAGSEAAASALRRTEWRGLPPRGAGEGTPLGSGRGGEWEPGRNPRGGTPASSGSLRCQGGGGSRGGSPELPRPAGASSQRGAGEGPRAGGGAQ